MGVTIKQMSIGIICYKSQWTQGAAANSEWTWGAATESGWTWEPLLRVGVHGATPTRRREDGEWRWEEHGMLWDSDEEEKWKRNGMTEDG